MIKLALTYLVLINLIAFAAFGIDKWKARNNAWRILFNNSEAYANIRVTDLNGRLVAQQALQQAQRGEEDRRQQEGRQHNGEKLPVFHRKLAVEVQILGIAEGGQHAA